jgi:hypothetical protein
MRWKVFAGCLFSGLLLAMMSSACSTGITPVDSTASPTITLTFIPSFTPTITLTATPTATDTLTPTPTDTRTPRPTRTFTPAPSATASVTPAGTLTPTPPQAEAGPFKSIFTLKEYVPGILQKIYPLDNDSLWISGTYGMIQVQLSAQQSTLLRNITDILGVDASGRIWQLRNNGAVIAAYTDGTWTEYSSMQGWTLAAQMETSPLPTPAFQYDSAGNLWLATAVDLRRFNGKSWVITPINVAGLTLPYKAGVTTSTAFAIDPSGSGRVWIGSCNWQNGRPAGGGGLQVWQDQQWQSADFPVANPCITNLQVDQAGTLWAAAGSDLWRHPENGNWEQITNPEPAPANSTYQYIEQLDCFADGSVWVLLVSTTADGKNSAKSRFLVQNDHLRLSRQANGIDQLFLAERPDGSVWSFEQNAIYQYIDGESWSLIADLSYRSYAIDPSGAVWLLTDTKDVPIIWRALP